MKRRKGLKKSVDTKTPTANRKALVMSTRRTRMSTRRIEKSVRLSRMNTGWTEGVNSGTMTRLDGDLLLTPPSRLANANVRIKSHAGTCAVCTLLVIRSRKLTMTSAMPGKI